MYKKNDEEMKIATKYTAEEIAALDRKLCNPAENVVCPRCGKTLVLKAGRFGCEVKCESENCLRGVVRGI